MIFTKLDHFFFVCFFTKFISVFTFTSQSSLFSLESNENNAFRVTAFSQNLFYSAFTIQWKIQNDLNRLKVDKYSQGLELFHLLMTYGILYKNAYQTVIYYNSKDNTTF